MTSLSFHTDFVVDMVDLSADEADALRNMLLIGPTAALFATASPKKSYRNIGIKIH